MNVLAGVHFLPIFDRFTRRRNELPMSESIHAFPDLSSTPTNEAFTARVRGHLWSVHIPSGWRTVSGARNQAARPAPRPPVESLRTELHTEMLEGVSEREFTI